MVRITMSNMARLSLALGSACLLLLPKPASTFNPASLQQPICLSTTKLHAHSDRRSAIQTLLAGATGTALTIPSAVVAEEDVDGIPLITRSGLGTSIRRTTVKSAQIADSLDEKWERFSDSRRDKNRCDPNTNRRLFDNGFRKDGTRVGDPVLGALCDPIPLRDLDESVAAKVFDSAEEQAAAMLGGGDKRDTLRAKVRAVDELVGPSFARAEKKGDSDDDQEEAGKRREYNKSTYVRMRAYGDALMAGPAKSRESVSTAAEFEIGWGRRLLFNGDRPPLVPPNLTNRKSFKSPFPALSEEDKGDLAYEEGSLLDALGTTSAALAALQDGGIVGHWEISIPYDDYGEVVTIAVDDDVSLGSQALLKEQRGFNGSVVTAVVRAALDKMGITCNVDAFFLDPSTTKQDVYEPTQLLLNLSNIRSK